MNKKPIILFDFDGVIHSYKSGWKGAKNIPDPPVDGAIQFLVSIVDAYEICIYSARSRQFGGKRAMKKWIKKWFIYYAFHGETSCTDFVMQTAFADPWEYEVEWAAKRLLRSIKFPTKKPAAFLTIDDRAICFDGDYGSLLFKIMNFKPWHKGEV